MRLKGLSSTIKKEEKTAGDKAQDLRIEKGQFNENFETLFFSSIKSPCATYSIVLSGCVYDFAEFFEKDESPRIKTLGRKINTVLNKIIQL